MVKYGMVCDTMTCYCIAQLLVFATLFVYIIHPHRCVHTTPHYAGGRALSGAFACDGATAGLHRQCNARLPAGDLPCGVTWISLI